MIYCLYRNDYSISTPQPTSFKLDQGIEPPRTERYIEQGFIVESLYFYEPLNPLINALSL